MHHRLKLWYNSGLTTEEYYLIEEELYINSLKRAIFLLYILAILFTAYGFTSTEYFQKFDPSISIWQNTWPRFCFNSIPFILLSIILKRINLKNKTKLILVAAIFSIIYFIAACINAWPIALNKHPEILIYVNAPNICIFSLVFMVIAPPINIILILLGILILIFMLPFFLVAYFSGDIIITKTVMSDLTLALISDVMLGSWISIIQAKNKLLESEKQKKASQFLGPHITKAVYDNDNKEDLLKNKVTLGYIISIDIRNYTVMKEKDPKKWQEFINNYQAIVKSNVYKNNGYVHKTMGDGHIISFGVFGDQINLSDIPGIEEDEIVAHRNTNIQTLFKIIECLQSLINDSQKEIDKLKLDTNFSIRGGISFGDVETSLCGDEIHLEYDIGGDAVILATRLESYCKYVIKNSTFNENTSVILLSPSVVEYYKYYNPLCVNEMECQRFLTLDNPIRSFKNIPWVLPIVLSPKMWL